MGNLEHSLAGAIAAAERMQRTIAELQESLLESAVGMAFGWQECERHLAAAQRLVRQGASVDEVAAEQAAAVRAFGDALREGDNSPELMLQVPELLARIKAEAAGPAGGDEGGTAP